MEQIRHKWHEESAKQLPIVQIARTSCVNCVILRLSKLGNNSVNGTNKVKAAAILITQEHTNEYLNERVRNWLFYGASGH